MAAEADGLISLATVRNNNLILDTNILYQFLTQPHIQGRPLVVISIAGAFRSGKSFIMNFFLRYLRNKGWESDDWFGDRDTPIEGFPWRRGEEACTQGITVWPEVFSVPTVDGRQAAVIIVDTQGLFDDNTSPDINAKLMSLSALFCSHQILNLRCQIEERDLEHLELCIEFAKAAAGVRQVGRGKRFQKLMFLIRDWEHEDSFGDATNGYLRRYFKKRSQSPEVQKVKDSIASAFDEVACTVLPHPGKKVVRRAHSSFNGDIDEDFRECVPKLIAALLQPQNLAIKRSSNGDDETTRGLVQLISTVGKAFQSGKVPTADTLLTSVTKGNNLKAMTGSVAKYKADMEQVCHEMLDARTLEQCHRESLQSAERHFRTLANMGDEANRTEFLQQLRKECRDELESLTLRNKGKMDRKLQTFRKSMRKNLASYARDIKEAKMADDLMTLERTHRDCRRTLRSRFYFDTKDYETMIPGIQSLRKELDEAIASCYAEAKQTWTERNKRKKARNREESSNCVYNIKKEFEDEIEEYERKYVPGLKKILEDLKKETLKKYDKQMMENSERETVEKNKKKLEKDLEQLIQKSIRSNSDRRASEVQLLKTECACTYKSEMKKIGLDVPYGTFSFHHEWQKQEAFKKFDDETKGEGATSQEVQEQRSKLSQEISDTYDSITQNRKKEKEMKNSRLRASAAEKKDELVTAFDEAVKKYESRYHDGLSETLGNLKTEYVGKYDEHTSTNPFGNKDAFKQQLDKIIEYALSTNRKNQDIFEQEIKNFKQKCREEFEEALKDTMNDAVLKEDAFVDHKKQFLRELRDDDYFKKLPGWAQNEVTDGIEDLMTQLKKKNESHREYRSAEVSSPSLFKRMWNGLKCLVQSVLGFFHLVKTSPQSSNEK